MSDLNIGFDLDKYPTLKAAAESTALIRLIRGAAGSGKTSFAIMELFRTALLQAPSPVDNTRYTRMLVVRNTYSLLKSNTIPSMKNMLGPLLSVTEGSQPVGKVVAQLNDGTRVQMDIQFLALDSEDAQDKLLGAEPTMVLCDELNMMPESVIFALVRRLGRYPSGTKGKVSRTGIIGVFNGPVKGSWLHRWWLGERDKEFEQTARQMGIEKFVDFFAQPPALLRPAEEGGDWLPNPLAENIHNLAQGYGYYYAMLADPDPAKIQAYVEGDFADIKHGKVVFPEFHRDIHTFPAASVNTREVREYYLSFDFGRTPVCLVTYLAPDGSLLVLDEFMGEDMSVDFLYRNTVLPELKRRYPNALCAKAWGDPAGMVQGQNLDLSPFDVLRNLGVPIVPPTRSNKLEPRLQAVRAFMNNLGMNGKPRLRIRDNCKFLIQSMAADYIYENKKGSSGLSETPTKSHVGWVSDLCLAEGTLISTPKGNIPIERIKVGDEVFTRSGVRKVLAAEKTGDDSLVYDYSFGGIILTATPNHPVFANNGFYAIDSLVGYAVYCNVSKADGVKLCKHTRLLKMLSSLVGNVLPDTQGTNIIGGKLVTTTMNGIEKAKVFLCIDILGRSIMDLFLLGIKSTTKTMTLVTILLRTWNSLKQEAMQLIIPKKDWPKIQSTDKSFMPQVLRQQKNGTNQKRGDNGIANTQRKLCLRWLETVLNWFVHGAEKLTLGLRKRENVDFAGHLARGQHEKLAALMMSNENAANAVTSSQPTNIQKRSIVAENVLTKVSRGKERRVTVYNLTVEHDNEYYANGILVHNCDALQYACMGSLTIISDAELTVENYDTNIDWFA